jgi:acyl carrier protein
MSNIEKYNQVFTSSFLVTVEQVPKMSLGSSSAWDSVGHMGLIAAMEETFGISMSGEDIIDFSSYEIGKQILKKYNIDL